MRNISTKMHPKIQQCCLEMQFNVDLPFYGNLLLLIAGFHERPDIKTCAVNFTSAGMQFYYNSLFLDSLPQKQVNYIVLHEIMHLLWSHPKRTILGQFNYKLANIAQDMIINYILYCDISHDFIEIPKFPNGENMAIFVPHQYDGPLIFEFLYDWLQEEKEDYPTFIKKPGGKSEDTEEGTDNVDDAEEGSDQKDYGKLGKMIPKKNENIDTYSLEHIFKNLDESEGEYLDDHIGDTIPEALKEAMVSDIMDKMSNRGFVSANITQLIEKLRKKSKDELSHIKRTISNSICGGMKLKSILKPNRRDLEGVKGKKKIKNKITCILDTSNSMSGKFDKVLSFIYRNDIETDLIEADTEVKWIKKIKNAQKLQSTLIKGLGGTILQPAVDLVVQKYNRNNLLILTDGICDDLDLSKIKGNILIISVDREVPISKTNGKVKQITISKTE